MQYYTKFCNRRVCEDVKMLFRAFFVEIIALICRKTTIRTKKIGNKFVCFNRNVYFCTRNFAINNPY